MSMIAVWNALSNEDQIARTRNVLPAWLSYGCNPPYLVRADFPDKKVLRSYYPDDEACEVKTLAVEPQS